MLKLKQIPLVKQTQLNRAPFHQRSNRAGLERRYPCDALLLFDFVYLLLRNHSPVTHQRHALNTKIRADFFYRGHQRLRVADVAFKHLYGNRASGAVCE